MTLIEFFDTIPINNIIAALALHPDRIIFLGTDRQAMSNSIPRILKILSAKQRNTSPGELFLSMRVLESENLTATLVTLSDILHRDSEFVCDITGGSDMVLVALGMVCAASGKQVSLFRIDPLTKDGTLYTCPTEKLPYTATYCTHTDQLRLRVRENLLLHRGVLHSTMYDHTASPMSQKGMQRLEKLWQLCRSDCGYWNQQIGRLSAAVRPYKVHGKRKGHRTRYMINPKLRGLDESFLTALVDGGFLRLGEVVSGSYRQCTFADACVRGCLLKAGTLLEYRTCLTAMCMHNTPFTDGCAGVVIDWHEKPEKLSQKQTAMIPNNEIDTLLMAGITPVFISCKNGDLDPEELYKLSTVADRFGGTYAYRVLVVTSYFDKEDRHYGGKASVDSLRNRAKEMHIQIIENAHKMTNAEFATALRNVLHTPQEQ